MKTPLISKRIDCLVPESTRQKQRGVTIVLVALAMVAIIAMAALSIDVITLYLARAEAQKAADASALAAARILSVSGITGDPLNVSGNWVHICGPDNGTDGLATRVAKAVANQNTIGGATATTTTVNYSAGSGGGSADCSSLGGTPFGVNPIVTVQVRRDSLPTFFSRLWGNTGNTISASAAAEAYNPSNSGNAGITTGTIIPVKPRCVKPWIVPNLDPYSFPNQFVDTGTGNIKHQGISLGGTSASGVIGETFWLVPDCEPSLGNCTLLGGLPSVQPTANYNSPPLPGPNLLYVPGQTGTPAPIGVPSCTGADTFEVAIEGCDQPDHYLCGYLGAGNVDLSENPISATTDGIQCLTHQGDTSITASSTGQDHLNPFGAPSSYPFQILAGTGSAAVAAGLPAESQVSTSTSIASLPIYDNVGTTLTSGALAPVTFVGFLQVFINAVDANGNINVTVLNVSGCSNGSGATVGNPVIANSPVPVRLITPP